MKARVLPELPDQETETGAVFTWKVEGWRSMAKKERGPTFQCGGYPWWVLRQRLVCREGCACAVLKYSKAGAVLSIR